MKLSPRPLTRAEQLRAWVEKTAYCVTPKPTQPTPQQPAPKAG